MPLLTPGVDMTRKLLLKIQNPNAWISQIHKLGTLLDSAYANTRGEIWLFDNDLKVLEDDTGSFTSLYEERIDGSLSAQILSIKILLSKPYYDRFCDKHKSHQLFENLCRIRPDRLRTFYVGKLEEVKPKTSKASGGKLPWIFYLTEQHLKRPKGIVIVRPKEFPFASICNEESDDDSLAVAWDASDQDVEQIYARLRVGKFHDIFVKNLAKNFKSIEPICDDKEKVIDYKLIEPRKIAEVNRICSKIPNTTQKPIKSPIDFAIITTLNEEFKAAENVFALSEHGTCSFGWVSTPTGMRSIVLVQCNTYGSVSSAEATSRVLHEWAPKFVFLLGRCGGWRDDEENLPTAEKNKSTLQEGDVVVANRIFTYEYQALKKNKQGELVIEYDTRTIPSSTNLKQHANKMIRNSWTYLGEVPDDLGLTRKPLAVCGDFACGNKLIRQGSTWFDEIKIALGARKIVAVEMEGEGVWCSSENFASKPEFLMIKGISDFADSNKTDKYKEVASLTAAQFLFDMLTNSQLGKS